ncbi:MAG TPA: hypothetical protein VGV37_07375 [Aliidongia sp.]|uniref:hypothetical protein n=1 Tax=Aliidongia sp. TaxID=1914230 RepID=UPI002DDD4E52|nr:hypothetical protein [Aliidongia sp.]HEV2674347.1 hypothetical protein [Aliidongia sp.]
MAEYRLYALDAQGHIVSRQDLDCESDDAAITLANQTFVYDRRELWDGARLVRSWAALHPSAARRRLFPSEPGAKFRAMERLFAVGEPD